MIDATQADIGRRVTYDATPVLKHKSHGKLVGIESPRCVWVLFDEADGPIQVISNLKWADQ